MRNKETHIFFKIRAFFKIHVPFFVYLTYGKFFLINIFGAIMQENENTLKQDAFYEAGFCDELSIETQHEEYIAQRDFAKSNPQGEEDE
ncbi:hypothetical protein C2R69_08470 [Helicobacter pylori]|nr:hypothetical protein C2R69_08470 [Helicobacter pylori]